MRISLTGIEYEAVYPYSTWWFIPVSTRVIAPVKVYMTYDITCKIDYGNLLKEIFALNKYIQGGITSMYSGDVMKI